MKIRSIVFFAVQLFFIINISAQTGISILQEEYEYYENIGLSPDSLEKKNLNSFSPRVKSVKNCNLNKIVFGWHPYWSNGLENNYEWSLLSDLSYFGYNVNPATGNANSTYDWATVSVVDSALAHNVRVNLCVTLFSDHATFFGNTTAKQTLITNLINLIQQRNAHGVNIDFEAVPSSQKIPMTNFIISLSTQMKTAIPNAQISIALPAVDWSGTFDVVAILPYVDLFLIMGYDYYYSTSSQAGPSDPLYTHISSYDRNISKSINYYLLQGIPSNKLALGLPYYGREWETVSNTIPANTTGNYNGSRTFKVVKDNDDGYYSNPVYYNKAMSTYHAFQISTAWHQLFINDVYTMGKRYDMVKQRNLAGIGIWALGYDDGYNDFWNLIENKFSNCASVLCTDTIYDMGGPLGNYYADENYSFTINPSASSGVSLSFLSFNLSTTDTLKLFNGPSVNAPLIGAYTGNANPGNVIASGNTLTLSFKSGSGATSSGWIAVWNCVADTTSPTTTINNIGNWETQHFTVDFNDNDSNGSGIARRFYQVSDFDGNNWSANNDRGFISDNFEVLNNQLWTTAPGSGTWTIDNNSLWQSDTTISNSNIYAPLNQVLSNRYLYCFKAKIEGTNTTKRFGFHFFADSAQYSNRKNSYFIWFRQNSSQLEFYKVVNDTFSLVKTVSNVPTITGQWYDIKVVYDRIDGDILVYRDNELLGIYKDPSPLSNNGNYISFRSAECQFFVDSLNIFRTRNSSTNILVGTGNLNDLRFENINSITPAAKIKSIVSDSALNLSNAAQVFVNIDWSPPVSISNVNDGLAGDIDTVFLASSLSANWTSSADTNSDIESYWYAIGTSPNDSDVVGWTNSGLGLSVTHTGLNLIHNATYYLSVKARNGAGLWGNPVSSNGQTAILSTIVVADFEWSSNNVCTGNNIHFTNTSANAINIEWYFQGGDPMYSTDNNPIIYYHVPGVYQVKLIAYNGTVSDTLDMPALISVHQNVVASFYAPDTVFLPSAFITFNNNSTFGSNYFWDFGDGGTSVDFSPWHQYISQGIYSVSLVSSNNHCSDTAFQTIYVTQNLNVNALEFFNDYLIFPNPFIDQLNFISYSDEKKQIGFDLIDMLGVTKLEIPERVYEKGHHIIYFGEELKQFAPGMYFLKVRSENQSFLLKLNKID
ncbi:MAG: glycosyl hydrolase family 18 protein [Bacteroidales bacterium]|nr:glycosyl hydrolase family 18 protein [Bacteroidales bacterium]